MPDIPGFNVDEGSLRLREIAMLEWVCCGKLNAPQWEGPEDMPSTNHLMVKMVRGVPAHLKSFAVASFLMPEMLDVLEMLLLNWMN